MNIDLNNINEQELCYEAKNKEDLLSFCESNAIRDNSIEGYSFDYSGEIFIFSISTNKENSVFFENYFFQKIYNDKCLYLLLDSKLTDVDSKPDPETSHIMYYQPTNPETVKIIKIGHEIATASLEKIECGDFPSYTITPL